jgi:hypothetical protein
MADIVVDEPTTRTAEWKLSLGGSLWRHSSAIAAFHEPLKCGPLISPIPPIGRIIIGEAETYP